MIISIITQTIIIWGEGEHGEILVLWVIKFVVVIHTFNCVFKDSQQGKSWNAMENSPCPKFCWLNLMLISFILDCFLSNEFATLGNRCLMSVLVTHVTSFLGMASQLGCLESFPHFLSVWDHPVSLSFSPLLPKLDLAFSLFLVLVFWVGPQP